MRCVFRIVAIAAALVLSRSTGHACSGSDCLQIYSTADGGGALTISWDFANKKIPVFGRCFPDGCLYSAIDPGFRATVDPPPPGFYQLQDGTAVTVQIVDIDSALTVKVDDTKLTAAGQTALLGTVPTLHNHPSWQLRVPDGERGDYPIAFKLTTTAAAYSESAVFTVVVTNPTPPAASATPTATPTVTPIHVACPGDCDGNGAVLVNELISGVAAALDRPSLCKAACDMDGDGIVEVNELISAVRSALHGCPGTATPTLTVAVPFAPVQAILASRCALPTCHDTTSHVNDLVLDAEHAYDQIVGVEPTIDIANQAGMFRVDPGKPENSFLLVKLAGPPLDQGMRMPLGGPYLDDADMQLIRDWIAHGAGR